MRISAKLPRPDFKEGEKFLSISRRSRKEIFHVIPTTLTQLVLYQQSVVLACRLRKARQRSLASTETCAERNDKTAKNSVDRRRSDGAPGARAGAHRRELSGCSGRQST